MERRKVNFKMKKKIDLESRFRVAVWHTQFLAFCQWGQSWTTPEIGRRNPVAGRFLCFMVCSPPSAFRTLQ